MIKKECSSYEVMKVRAHANQWLAKTLDVMIITKIQKKKC